MASCERVKLDSGNAAVVRGGQREGRGFKVYSHFVRSALGFKLAEAPPTLHTYAAFQGGHLKAGEETPESTSFAERGGNVIGVQSFIATSFFLRPRRLHSSNLMVKGQSDTCEDTS